MDVFGGDGFLSVMSAPHGVFAPCESGCGSESTHAVGTPISGHRLVCEPCMDHGDRRRLWNLEPRQRL